MMLISVVSNSNGGTELAPELQVLVETNGQVISVYTERNFLEEINRLAETVKPDEVVVFIFSGSIPWDIPRRNPVPCPEEIDFDGPKQSIPRCVRLVRTNKNPALASGKILICTYTKEDWAEDAKKTGCVFLKDLFIHTLINTFRVNGIR